MKVSQLGHLLDDKKYDAFRLEFLHLAEKDDELIQSELIYFYQRIDQKILNNFPEINHVMWKVSVKNGKLKMAENCAESFLKYLVDLKRVARIKFFLDEIHSTQLFSRQVEHYQKILNALVGNKEDYISINIDNDIFIDWHDEYWGNNRENLKKRILENEIWSITQIKDVYEFILKYHDDEEVLLFLRKVIKGSKKYYTQYLKFMRSRNINMSEDHGANTSYELNSFEELKINYDDLALNKISNQKEITEIEQQKVIKSLELMDSDELFRTGTEMLIAFKFLEMNKVVFYLSQKLLLNTSDPIFKASIEYIRIQALIDEQMFFEAQEEIDKIISIYPLLDNELLAFLNLKLFILEKEEKKEEIKDMLIKIKKLNPQHFDLKKWNKIFEKNK